MSEGVEEAPRDSPVCGDRKRFIFYTCSTMFIDSPLSVERQAGRSLGTRILRFSGPLTLRNLFIFQDELRQGLDPFVAIIDLTKVPYMDSAGMGALINYYVHCEKIGVKMTVAGVSSRVMELFKLTRVDTVIPLAATVEEAEGEAPCN
jgi:anti-sigma B factor antagonist